VKSATKKPCAALDPAPHFAQPFCYPLASINCLAARKPLVYHQENSDEKQYRCLV
jgi:hypothetical protein